MYRMKILKIGAVWCSGCLVMRPRWKKIEAENTGFETQYFEYDESPDIVKQYKLEATNLPVFIFLANDGTELTRFNGEVDEKTLIATINTYKNR